MKLSAWAKQQGLTYKTAWRMWRDGKLPIPAEQMPTGTVIVHPPSQAQSAGAALYARVSSADQRTDLDRQLARLSEYAARSGLHVVEAAREIGSGLNGHRRTLVRLLRDPQIQAIVVEHRDRLTRFGFEYVEAALAAQGRTVLVVDADEVADDVVRDLHEVIVSMCARLYGRRAAANKARRAMQAVEAD